MARTPSFVIYTPRFSGRTVLISPEGRPRSQLSIGSRRAGRTTEYFVTFRGEEPRECHMVIRSRVPIVEDAPLPPSAFFFCRGDCRESDEKCTYISTEVDPVKPDDVGIRNSAAILCSCTLDVDKLLRQKGILRAAVSRSRTKKSKTKLK